MGNTNLKFQLSLADKFAETTSVMILIALWVLVIFSYSKLPEQIPTHFDGQGNPDGFGDKNSILTFPLIATALYVGMSYLNTKPHLFNYPVEVTVVNREKLYRSGRSMIRVLKLAVIIIFALITYQSMGVSLELSEGLGSWFLPLTLALTFLPAVYFLIKISRIDNKL